MKGGGFCVLNEVYDIIVDRLERRPRGSYTATLAGGGVEAVAKKVGEEAVETVIEALRGDRDRVAEEASDLLYHLLLLLALRGLRPGDVEAVLRSRMGGGGVDG